MRHVFAPPFKIGHSPSCAARRSTNDLTNRVSAFAVRIEVMTELRPREDAAVKAHQRDPFRVLARPAERFQLAISSSQVLDHLLISVLVLYKKTMDFLQ